MASDAPDAALRLSDLRRAQAADVSLENLLTAITSKIQDCARLAVFEYEAGNEGHPELALAFRALADVERESFKALLDHLRRHLNAMPEAAPADPFRSPSAVAER